MQIPSGCTNSVNKVIIEDENIIFVRESNGVETIVNAYNVPKNVFWKVAPDWDENPEHYQGFLYSNENDKNVPSFETAFNQNIVGARYLTWRDCGSTVDHAMLSYGGCGNNCVGCTTCNGCYDNIVTDGTCWACYNGCRDGCTTGCTNQCTTACTDNYEGRKGKDENGNMFITCKGCNTECNNCTFCTGCVDNIERMYCYLATTCNGCTSGETAQVERSVLQSYYDCKSSCQNGLNGLYDGASLEHQGIVVDISKCYTVVTNERSCKNMALQCELFTNKYVCDGHYTCANLNNKACSSCDGSCDGCTESCAVCQPCAGRCVASCYGACVREL